MNDNLHVYTLKIISGMPKQLLISTELLQIRIIQEKTNK